MTRMNNFILSAVQKTLCGMKRYLKRRRGSLGPRVVFMTLVAMSDPDKRSYCRGIQVVF